MTNSANGEGIIKSCSNRSCTIVARPSSGKGSRLTISCRLVHRLKQHRLASVDPGVLAKYVGRYSDPVHFPNVMLTIRSGGDHLSVQENDEPPQELLPESAVDFYSTNFR